MKEDRRWNGTLDTPPVDSTGEGKAATIGQGAEAVTGITAAVARHVHGLRYEDLPDAVIRKAKDVILDALACQLACTQLDQGRLAIEFARRHAGPPDATIIGSDFKTGVEHAALVNGIQGHGDEIDESLLGFGHASAVLVPAVLAVGEREKVTGADMIVALVAGYDLAGRLSRAGFNVDMLTARNWHPASVAGSLASAAATGRLLGLTVREVQAALGFAAEQACGLQARRKEVGHMNKSLPMGIGSRNGIASAYLAQVGYAGVSEVLDTPFSIFDAFLPDAAIPAELTREFGQRFEILFSRFKQYSSGSFSHCAIAAMLGIMTEHQLVAADIESILVKRPSRQSLPRSATIDLNLEHILAVAAVDGRVSWEQNSEDRRKDPMVRDLYERITTQGDPEMDALTSRSLQGGDIATHPADVTLSTRDGRTFTKRMIFPHGHPIDPLSREELDDKFMYWSTRVISTGQALRLKAMVESLEQVKNLNALGDLLRI